MHVDFSQSRGLSPDEMVAVIHLLNDEPLPVDLTARLLDAGVDVEGLERMVAQS